VTLKYRSLGRTGVQVSELCFGAMNFGDGTDDLEAERIIAGFAEVGGNFLDTANVYGAGKSEEMLGRVLKKQGTRNSFFLATKAHGKIGPGPNDFGNTQQHLVDACNDSLKRLQIDHIDLYQIHRPQPEVPIDETLGALDHLVNSGKVRYVGCSTYPAWSIVESLWASKEHHLVRFICDQPPYNIFDRRIERELIPMATTYGLAIIPWAPLAGGMLSGKYHRDSAAPEGSRYSNDKYRGTPISEEIWNAIESLETLAKETNTTLSQLSLAWVLSRPGVTSPIIGVRTAEQLEDNLKATEVQITAEVIAAIDKIVPPGTHVKSYYEVNTSPTARW
jgi:aryl-alcohol dehydrogenase-like predicted oxidoreductase